MNAYFAALFQGTSKRLSKEINKKKRFLSQTIVRDDYAQGLLLTAMEVYCSSESFPELQKETSAVLKMLYDLDIIEEDAIIAWYNGASDSSQVKKFAKPFVKWLQSAEYEEE
jgi:translation initiation factor 5